MKASRHIAENRPAEIGTVRKTWADQIKIGLFYPNQYALAMSNLGYQTLYRLLNQEADVVCERFLVDDLRKLPTPLPLSRESRRPARDFDILAFSIAFENDYPNILHLLNAVGLPLKARDRDPQAPLVMAGGVAVMLNPEPLAPFFDLFLIGEAEAVLTSFLDGYRRTDDRRTFLDRIPHDVLGAYVPRHYHPTYHPDGPLAAFTAADHRIARVKSPKADVTNLQTATTVLTAGTAFADTCLIEVSRGCPHGCRFCSAGYIYRPPRYRRPECLAHGMRDASRNTRRVGLVGAAVSDYPALGALCEQAADMDLRFSFSSLRADALTGELLTALQANRTKTATIAPEAGSARLRTAINKGLTEEDILAAVEKLVRAGIPNLKLYFMVGLPTETNEDIDAIVILCQAVKTVFLSASRKMKRIGNITVNATPFVPKPSTPFQWAAMTPLRVIKKRLRFLRNRLQRMANVRFQHESPREAYVQALLARGDRRIGDMLLQHHRTGGRWSQTIRDTPLSTDWFTLRERPGDELLPWDFIDTGVAKDFLWQEYQRALSGRASKPCPTDGACQRCGACRISD
jgi:radical SAM superfamily enzyme YgiQ (UPF0313 family)